MYLRAKKPAGGLCEMNRQLEARGHVRVYVQAPSPIVVLSPETPRSERTCRIRVQQLNQEPHTLTILAASPPLWVHNAPKCRDLPTWCFFSAPKQTPLSFFVWRNNPPNAFAGHDPSCVIKRSTLALQAGMPGRTRGPCSLDGCSFLEAPGQLPANEPWQDSQRRGCHEGTYRLRLLLLISLTHPLQTGSVSWTRGYPSNFPHQRLQAPR